MYHARCIGAVLPRSGAFSMRIGRHNPPAIAMKHISSRDNPTYKYIARLARGTDPRHTVLEGIHLCQAWLRHPGMPGLPLFDRTMLEKTEDLPQLACSLDAGLVLPSASRLIRPLPDVEPGLCVWFLAMAPRPSPSNTI